MNSWSAMGRLTHDPELTQTPNGVSVCKFRIAVNRKYRNKDGEYEADFINCVAWRSTAEFVSKYFSKGSMMGVVGSIQTRTYDDSDGKKRYITEVVIEDVTFAESKKSNYSGQSASTETSAQQNSDPMDAFDDEFVALGKEPDDLPF